MAPASAACPNSPGSNSGPEPATFPPQMPSVDWLYPQCKLWGKGIWHAGLGPCMRRFSGFLAY